jgi:hypothetical protein
MDKPKLPPAPKDGPYSFDDFVLALQQDRIYAHKVHKMVLWGRKEKGKEQEALDALERHVNFSPVLDELGVTEAELNPKCSNNTKFSMLDFSKYV